MTSYENQENKTYGFWWGLGAVLGVGLAFVLSLAPTKVSTNTLADEEKIMELCIPRAKDGQNRLAYYRDEIIEEFYSQATHPGFNSIGPEVSLTIAACCAIISIYFWISFFLGALNISGYLKARAEYLTEKTRAERGTLDELLRLQKKISGE